MTIIKNLIEQVIDFSKNKNKHASFDGKAFEQFVTIFYSQSKSRDFAHYSAEDLCNFALLSFGFFSNKKPGELKIRICNPTTELNGFDSFSTFVEIVNDDMPFLVDSTVSYLDKQGIKVKNIIHAVIFHLSHL